MGGIWVASSNFTKGQLDPLLAGRIDLEAYYQGVREATNVLAIPQGGLKKRPGMQFLGEALGDGRLESFSFNVEQNYLLVFTALKMQIYKDGVLQTNINGSGDDFLVIPWTLAQIQEFDYIQSADTIIITQEDVAPQIIQRTSDTAWSIAALGLINLPQFDFNDGSSPTPVSEVQDINFSGIEQGSTVKLSLEGVLTEDFSYEGNNSDMAEAIEEQLQTLPNTGSTGITVAFTGGTLTNATFRVTFAGASAKDWRPLTGFMVQGRVTGDEQITTVRITSGTARSEDVWSSTRGWPRTATFHEARLFFGGSRSRPSTMWGSRVNELLNFDAGRARDDEALDVTLSTDQINAINGIVSNKSLQIFTSGAEFYVPESPITPANVAVKPQTNLGSKRVRPISIEGVTLFIQRTGKAIYQFQFLNDFQSNESRSVSLLAPDLIKDPSQMAASRGTSESDANYVYLVSNDGIMTVLNTQSLEGVQAFTTWQTDGDIVSVAVVDDEVNLLVKRVIGGGDVYYVEKGNEDLNTDSSVSATVSSDTLTGLDHLEGETVKVKADGAVQLDEVVSSGQITIDHTATIIEAGLEYQPRIETLPLNIPLNNGPNAAQKKKIARVAVQLFESNGIIVNGERLSDRVIGQNQFDPPTPQTGFKRIYLLGWSLEATVVISQDTPMPFTILALDLEVKV